MLKSGEMSRRVGSLYFKCRMVNHRLQKFRGFKLFDLS